METQLISENALIKRINRILAKEDWPKKLCKSREGNERMNLGDYYMIDVYTNTVIDSHINLNEYSV